MKALSTRWFAPVLAVLVLAFVALGFARRTDSAPREFDPPALRVEIDELGGEIARFDESAMRRAFADAGLPDPPSLDGLDAVVVRNALAAAERWVERAEADGLGELGAVYLALERREHAAECFAAAARFAAQREPWLYLLGVTSQRLQWDQAALEALEQARALDARHALTHARLGELLLSRGRERDALASFDTALTLQPDLSVAATGKARAQLALGELKGALAAAQVAVRAQPRDFAARRVLADVLARGGLAAEAQREARIADSLPKYQGWGTFDKRWLAALGKSGVLSFAPSEINSAVAAGDFAFAFARVGELLARRPRDPAPLVLLATMYANTDQLAKAREAIEKAVAMKPDNVSYRISAGEIALANSDVAAAAAAVDAALAREPNSFAALQLRGRVRFVSGQREQGLADLRAVVDAAPTDVANRSMLLEMLRQDGREAQARAFLEEALALAATREWAQSEIAKSPSGGKQ